MDKSFKQQESNSVLSSDGVDDVEGTAVLKAIGESAGQKCHERIWWTLSNVSVAALALAMSFGFGVATGEVAGASVSVHPAAHHVVSKPATRFIVSKPATRFIVSKPATRFIVSKPATRFIVTKPATRFIVTTPKNRQRAVLVSETYKLGTVPQKMNNNNPQIGHWTSPQNGHWT